MSKDDLIELIMNDLKSQKDVINEIEVQDIDDEVLMEINHDVNSNLYVKHNPNGISYVYDQQKKSSHIPIDDMITKLEQGINYLKSIKDKAELVTIERNDDRDLYFIDTIDSCISYELSIKKR